MKLKTSFIALVPILLLGLIPALKAQNSIEGYVDFGKNQISGGLHCQMSNIGYFEKSRWGIQGGYQVGLIQANDVFFNGWKVSPYMKIQIGNTRFDLGVEYTWTAFSPVLRETDRIVFARTGLTHWQFLLGTNTRTYRLSYNATEPYGRESRIIERWNMMYQVKYTVKPNESRWNLSGTLTNFDHFIIQQENNPMLNLRFNYITGDHVELYSELWCKSAGLMVLRRINFGRFIRLGLLWKI